MDEEKEISSTFIADDRIFEHSDPDKCGKDLKEKSELMYEINTICNMNSLMSPCKLQNNKLDVEHDQQIVLDTVTEHHFQSNPNCDGTDNFSDGVVENISESVHESELKLETLSPSVTDTYEKEQRSKTMCEEAVSQKMYIDWQEVPDSHLSYEMKRPSRRSSKRKKDFDECCPICGVTVRSNDLESHYKQEVERLSKLSRCSKKTHHEETPKNEVFDQVKHNRENRLTARVARFSARAKNEVKCPVCSLRMSGTADEINRHVAYCIQDEDTDVDVEGEEDEDMVENFEEYEIGDETRIRAIDLVPGGYRSLHGQSSNQVAPEDEDLNVDIDDTITYGEAQYSEIDVIPNTSSEEDRLGLEQLRKAVVADSTLRPHSLENPKWSKTDSENSSLPEGLTDSDPVVSALKEKINALEDQDKSVRCLICLESYTKPVVSTTCWHVHCEECWLMTMGVKKLCPQCNMIVFPSDLRKIYL